MKNSVKWLGIIAIVAVIVFSLVSCDLFKDTISLEGSWGLFYSTGTFTFEGDNFTWQEPARPRRKGTFTRTASQITFTSIQEWIWTGSGYEWVPLTSPPSGGTVSNKVIFLDTGSPIKYKFEFYSDNSLRGVTIGDTVYVKQ